MPKRKTIGTNPLDAVVPSQERKAQERQQPQAPTTSSKEKQRLTVHLTVNLIERAKNAVWWTPGLTLAGLAEQALIDAVDAMEQERGEPFLPRREELKGGRPMK